MPNKEIRQEYDKKLNKITLRLSKEEKVNLSKMMKEEEWSNVAGFIKYKLFGEKADAVYARMKRNSEPEDISIIMKILMESLVNEIGYLNYRFNYELERLDKNSDKLDDKIAKKILSTMTQWKKNIMERTEQICYDCQDILRYIDIKIDKIKKENIHFAPESLIDKARKDWNDTMSPEALEGVRRDFEKLHKQLEEEYKKH